MGILLGLFVLGVLVLVHEAGHMFVAKSIGVPVHKFSIGFGPALVSKKFGGTEYRISAFPFGGYVALEGEDVTELGKPGSFRAQPAWKQFVTYLAGPATNLLVGYILYTGAYLTYGVPVLSSRIGEVVAGSPAAQAGLVAGDRITAVSGSPVTRWEEAVEHLQIASGNGSVVLTITRGETVSDITVTPELKDGRPRIGIMADMANPDRLRDPGVAVQHGIRTGNFVLGQMTGLLKKLFVGEAKIKDNLGGPVQIVAVGSQAYRERGLEGLLMLAAGLSLGLFLFNLLPIPIVDGGQIVLVLLAAVRGKQLELRTEIAIKNVVVLFLLGLALFLTYNDIVRLFTK